MLKRLLKLIISIIIPPIGIFFILKSKNELYKPKRAKINLTCILLVVSAIFWTPVSMLLYDKYDNYRKPLTTQTNEKHRQAIEDLYNEYLEIKENYRLDDWGYPKDREVLEEWNEKINSQLSSYETREEFSDIHNKASSYFVNLFFGLSIPNGDTKYNVSKETEGYIESFLQAVIDSNDEEAYTWMEVIESGTSKNAPAKENKTKVFDSEVTVSSVRNDNTGRWKKVLISENVEIQEKALDYYNTYFNDKKEIHAIINFANNTTTKIAVVADFLDVTIYQYVTKEEHDANILFSGMVLKQYFVNISTGKIDEIQ